MKKLACLLLVFVSMPLSAEMKLSSDSVEEGSRMEAKYSFDGFGCSGDNLLPQLQWEGAPEGTKSFAISVFDPDAPTESGFWHWQLINIPKDVTSIDEMSSGELKVGVQRKNDYGTVGYGGPCPPKGDGMHRYQFTVWALPVEELAVPENASNAVVGFLLNRKAVDKAQLTATYVNQ